MDEVDVWQAARQGLLEDVQVCPASCPRCPCNILFGNKVVNYNWSAVTFFTYLGRWAPGWRVVCPGRVLRCCATRACYLPEASGCVMCGSRFPLLHCASVTTVLQFFPLTSKTACCCCSPSTVVQQCGTVIVRKVQNSRMQLYDNTATTTAPGY